MRKLAIIGVILLIIIVAVVTAAAISSEFRDGAYNAVAGTILMPIHDAIVGTWLSIGSLGFTYIAAASIAFMVLGILFGYAWSHWLRPRIPIGQSKTTPQNIILQNAPPPAPPIAVQPIEKEQTT